VDELEKILKAYAQRPKDLSRAFFKALEAKEIKDFWDIFAPGSGAPFREEIKTGPPLAATGGDLGHAESLYSHPQPQNVRVEETGDLARILESVIGKALARHGDEMKLALSAILEHVSKAKEKEEEDEEEEEEMEKAVRTLLKAFRKKAESEKEEKKEEKKEEEDEKSEKAFHKIMSILTGKSENDKESDEKLTNQAAHQEEGKANKRHDTDGKFANKEEDKEKALDKALSRISDLESQVASLPSGKTSPSFSGFPDLTVKGDKDIAARLSGFLARDSAKLDRSMYGQLEYLYKNYMSSIVGSISKSEFDKALFTFNPETQELFLNYLKEAGAN
jgi:hypothetical protein